MDELERKVAALERVVQELTARVEALENGTRPKAMPLGDLMAERFRHSGEAVSIGERIRHVRKERKLTQKELGKRAGIAEPTIRRYELGKLNPKYETLEKIAKALNCNAQFLHDGISSVSQSQTPGHD